MTRTAFLIPVVLFTAECTRQPSPPVATKEDAALSQPPSPTPSPAVSPPASVGMTEAGPAPEAGKAAPIGARCEKDDDCGWDDPCAPKACGAKIEADLGKKCGKPATPGACRCAGNVCSLVRPEKARSAERTACQAHADCAFDPNLGSCVGGPPSSTPPSGIQCLCDTLNKWCVQMWQGDVPCKSSRDCSWRHLSGEGTSAAPAWYAPREKPARVRPCKDGEHDSVCVDGLCVIRAWKC